MDNNLARKKKNATKRSQLNLYPVRYFPRNSGLIGLQNLGNTCYMNAALQALSNCPQLTSYMLENYDNIRPGLAKNFALLLYEIWVHGHFFEYSNQSTPKVFYDYLTPTSILYGIESACPNFHSTAQQEDAQEFLKFFLDRIHEELKTPIKCKESANIQDSEETSADEEKTSSISDLNISEEIDLIDLRSSASSLNWENDKKHSNSNLNQISENCFRNYSIDNNDYIKSNEISNSQTYENLNGKDQFANEEKGKMPINHLSKSINIPVGFLQSNSNLTMKKFLSNSLKNYIVNEKVQINQITPGLGDNENFSCLNFDPQENDCKENDSNIPNYSKSMCSKTLEDCPDLDKEDLNYKFFEKELNIAKKNRLDKSSVNKHNVKQYSNKKIKEKIIYQSIISRMFDGEILNSVQCLTCRNVSTIKETFQDLSLPIPNKDDLQQIKQMNKYLCSLENSGYSSPKVNKKSFFSKVDNKYRKSLSDMKRMKLRNGSNYHRLEDDENNDLSLMNSNSLGKRFFNLPFIRQIIILLLFINYFLKVSVLYFLLSIFYWSQTNLWGPTITLNDCLDAFFSTDELKGNNMYSCGKCKKFRNGIKYTHLIKSPDILCIHFKRFRNELMFPSKISTYVSFPLRGLAITSHLINYKFDSTCNLQNINQSTNNLHMNSSKTDTLVNSLNECYSKSKRKIEIYDLVSVICHRGHYNSGHYITYALNCLDECWYEYDDRTVRKVDESKVLNCEAYVLFYKKSYGNEISNTSLDKSQFDSENNCKSLDEEHNQLLNSDNFRKKNDFDSNFLKDKKYKDLFLNSKKAEECLTRTEVFRKRKYDKIKNEIELNSMNECTDLLNDIKL